MKYGAILFLSIAIAVWISGCKDSGSPSDAGTVQKAGKDPATSPRAVIDRFNDSSGTLFVRDGRNGLPAANAPIDFDAGPFITRGFGPSGRKVRYYNFDVQSAVLKPVYAFFYESSGTPVDSQLHVLGLIPGDDGYTDLWQVHKVFVPDDYVANSVTSEQAIADAGYRVEPQQKIVNCPVVPEGSSAALRHGGGSAALSPSWYRDMIIFYFTFEEKELTPVGGTAPVSPIYVTFNVNPDQPGGGPPSGFMTETGTVQTHNVLATVPTDASYSPLWQVNMYDNASFGSVIDLTTAQVAPVIVPNAALVNCPVVWVE